VQRFSPHLSTPHGPADTPSGDRWQMDETYVKDPDSGATYIERSTSSGGH
jgi:hypothetical protein